MFESAGDREVSMRPISMWSDHGAPLRGRWWKAKRSTRSSTGLKILLAAGVVVAGVIGISGVYPQVIDAEWVQGARTYASRMPAPDAKTTTPDAKITRRSDIPASIQAPSPSTAPTTGGAPVAAPGPAAVVRTPRPTAPASKPLPQAEPLALAENPDASANADAPQKPASTVAARPAAPVVKRRVSRADPRRGSTGPFAFGWGGSPFRM
jgi:cytoskeletal protein RodZ